MGEIITTNKAGVEDLFPELKEPKGWWPVIPKDKAVYYVLIEDEKPTAFLGVVYIDDSHAEIQGLRASKRYRSPTAIFELMNYIGFKLMDYHVKIYVINDVALWGWLRTGFKIIKQKKMKYWTAYWVEREAISYGKTKDRN